MQRLENVLKKAFFLNQTRDDILDLTGFDLVEARYKFFKESRLHAGIVGKCGRDGELKLSGDFRKISAQSRKGRRGSAKACKNGLQEGGELVECGCLRAGTHFKIRR